MGEARRKPKMGTTPAKYQQSKDTSRKPQNCQYAEVRGGSSSRFQRKWSAYSRTGTKPAPVPRNGRGDVRVNPSRGTQNPLAWKQWTWERERQRRKDQEVKYQRRWVVRRTSAAREAEGNRRNIREQIKRDQPARPGDSTWTEQRSRWARTKRAEAPGRKQGVDSGRFQGRSSSLEDRRLRTRMQSSTCRPGTRRAEGVVGSDTPRGRLGKGMKVVNRYPAAPHPPRAPPVSTQVRPVRDPQQPSSRSGICRGGGGCPIM